MGCTPSIGLKAISPLFRAPRRAGFVGALRPGCQQADTQARWYPTGKTTGCRPRPAGGWRLGTGATKRARRRGLERCSCAHVDDRIIWLCHGGGHATVPVYYSVHVCSRRIRKTWHASWGGGMDAIYSATALRDHPCEVKQAARRGLVRITENGDATCSARRMCSDARWPRPRSERSMRSMFRRQSYVDAWTLRRAIALRVSMRQRAPSHRGARRDCPTMARLILTSPFLDDVARLRTWSRLSTPSEVSCRYPQRSRPRHPLCLPDTYASELVALRMP